MALDLLANGMTVDEGLEALSRIGATSESRVVVLPGDLGAWQRRIDGTFRSTSRTPKRGRRDTGAAPNIEEELRALWADLLGVDEVAETDDFFELGGHSLIAVRLLNRIEKRFGARLKLASLFEARTIRDLAALLRGSTEASPFVSLVAIQPTGSLPPLYVAHGVGGEVLSYSDLARCLGKEQPFYAFRAVGHDGDAERLSTIEEQAAFYISELRTHQPSGPYYLAGYSHGGRVAFEMAQQLSRAGLPVAFLGIIDIWPCEGLPKTIGYPFNFLANIPRWLWADVRLEGSTANLNRLKRLWQVAARRLRGSAASGDPAGEGRSIDDAIDVSRLSEHIRLTFEMNFQAFLKYRPTRYEGAVTLFRGRVQPLRSPQSRSLGWREFATDVRVVPTPGNHGSLMRSPYVEALAERLAVELSRARTAWNRRGEHAEASDDRTRPVTMTAESRGQRPERERTSQVGVTAR